MTFEIKAIDKIQFTEVLMKKNDEVFVVDIHSFTAKITIFVSRKLQIFLLLIQKVIILSKNFYFVDVFLKKLIILILKLTRANKYFIKLIKR